MSVTDDVLHVAQSQPIERVYKVRVLTTSAGPLMEPWRDPQAARRRAVAAMFARVAGHTTGVQEVWLRSVQPELEVVVVVRDLELARELLLRTLFIDLVGDALDPSVGELRIFAESEGVPEWLREGQRLL